VSAAICGFTNAEACWIIVADFLPDPDVTVARSAGENVSGSGERLKKLPVRFSEVNSLAILTVAGVREACDVGKSFNSPFE
jgi:hypothetical protein